MSCSDRRGSQREIDCSHSHPHAAQMPHIAEDGLSASLQYSWMELQESMWLS